METFHNLALNLKTDIGSGHKTVSDAYEQSSLLNSGDPYLISCSFEMNTLMCNIQYFNVPPRDSF